MITFESSGNFNKLFSFLEKSKNGINMGILDKYGKLGVSALSAATPVNTSLTEQSWHYTIDRETNNRVTLNFNNSNIQNGCPIAIILQYGHATRNGGWVEGRDYINPAIRPLFNKLAEEAWKEATI